MYVDYYHEIRSLHQSLRSNDRKQRKELSMDVTVAANQKKKTKECEKLKKL